MTGKLNYILSHASRTFRHRLGHDAALDNAQHGSCVIPSTLQKTTWSSIPKMRLINLTLWRHIWSRNNSNPTPSNTRNIMGRGNCRWKKNKFWGGLWEQNRRGRMGEDDKDKITFKQRVSSRSSKDDLKRWSDMRKWGRNSERELHEAFDVHQRINLWFTNYWYLSREIWS